MLFNDKIRLLSDFQFSQTRGKCYFIDFEPINFKDFLIQRNLNLNFFLLI